MMSKKLAAVLAVALLAGCGPTLRPLPDTGVAKSYLLGPGDEIRVITFGNDNLTAQFHVSDNGDIAMPLLGNVKASGYTPSQLSANISKELVSKQLLNNPSVSVEIINYRPI